jgi:predicted alpha/beta hydrolase
MTAELPLGTPGSHEQGPLAATACEQRQVVCEDGYRLTAHIVRGRSAHAVIVLAPALATPWRFYLPFALFAARHGFDCWVFDYRGCGSSIDRSFKATLRLEDWGRRDLDAVLREATGGHPAVPNARRAPTFDLAPGIRTP